MAARGEFAVLDDRLGPIIEWVTAHVRWFLLVLGLGVAAWLAMSCWYTVAPEETAVVLRLGRVIGTTGPGAHWKLPLGIDSVRRVPTARIFKQEFGFRAATAEPGAGPAGTDLTAESLILTGDLNVLDVQWIVQYRIEDPRLFLFHVRDPEKALRDLSEAVVQRVVGNRLGSDILTLGRGLAAAEAKEELQALLTAYGTGIRLVTVQLQNVTPPAPVRSAFNDVNEARQDRERMINMAQEKTNQIVPRARGQALQAVAEAEGFAIQHVNEAKGRTSRFLSVLAAYRQAREVTRRQLYLEALRDVNRSARAVYVIDGDLKGLVPWLPLDTGATPRAIPQGGK